MKTKMNQNTVPAETIAVGLRRWLGRFEAGRLFFLMVAAVALVSVASAQDSAAPEQTDTRDAATTETRRESGVQRIDPTLPPEFTGTAQTNGLNVNFRNAPIEQVLNYMADAAGYIIQLDTPVRGIVSLRGQNLTRDEIYHLVYSELVKNGYMAVQRGRILRVMERSRAPGTQTPVITGNDPESIPDTEEIVTQIIPIRFVEAEQLVADIQPFRSDQATLIANQAGNSIIITDTRSNIRHLLEIIRAIDSSAEDVTEVRTFKLEHADPTEMASLLTSLFPDQSGTSSPMRFGGTRGRGNNRGGGGGGFNAFAAFANAARGGGGQTDRIRQRKQVIAVPDPRTMTVVVTATRDLMGQIEQMVFDLDQPGRMAQADVIKVKYGDPNSILTALQDTFGANTPGRVNRAQSSPFATRIQQGQSGTSQNMRGTGGVGGARVGGGGIR